MYQTAWLVHLRQVHPLKAPPERQPNFCVNLRNLWEIVDDGLTVAEAGDLRYVQGVTGYSARTPPLPRSKPSPGCDTARR